MLDPDFYKLSIDITSEIKRDLDSEAFWESVSNCKIHITLPNCPTTIYVCVIENGLYAADIFGEDGGFVIVEFSEIEEFMEKLLIYSINNELAE